MVILHDAIKTIQNGIFVFFIKEQKPVSFQKSKNIRIKKQVGCFFKTTDFSQSWLPFNPLGDFPLITRSGTSHVIIRMVDCEPHT